jgi:dTDP-4-amino-4,6-dideoxygalactose transaminase
VIASRAGNASVARYKDILGYNFRMTELSAAIGQEQLKKLSRLIADRQDVAEYYRNELGDLPGLVLPEVGPDRTHAYYTYAMRLDTNVVSTPRDAILDALAAEGVECDAGYVLPLYYYPAFGAHGPADRAAAARAVCPNVDRLYHHELFLHVLVYGSMRHIAPQIVEAFRKVWRNLDKLQSRAA